MSKRILIAGVFNDLSKGVVTQGSELAKILANHGYAVITTSSYKNKYRRLIDIIISILKNKTRFDVGIVQFYSGKSLVWQSLACRLIKLLNKKLIITVHGGNVPGRIRKYPKRYLPILKLADVITCPSFFIVSALKEYGIEAIKINNSIPLKEYSFQQKQLFSPRLLWMRAFSEIYNPELAVKVIELLKPEYPEIKLYMAGPDLGTLQKAEEMIRGKNLSDNIEIVGFADKQKKDELAGLADIYINTNQIDNAPVTIVEMWAYGLPVITTDVGGINYLVEDGKTGLIAKNNCALDMAEKIKLVIRDNKLPTELANNGLKKAQEFSEETVFSSWQNLLEQF